MDPIKNQDNEATAGSSLLGEVRCIQIWGNTIDRDEGNTFFVFWGE